VCSAKNKPGQDLNVEIAIRGCVLTPCLGVFHTWDHHLIGKSRLQSYIQSFIIYEYFLNANILFYITRVIEVWLLWKGEDRSWNVFRHFVDHQKKNRWQHQVNYKTSQRGTVRYYTNNTFVLVTEGQQYCCTNNSTTIQTILMFWWFLEHQSKESSTVELCVCQEFMIFKGHRNFTMQTNSLQVHNLITNKSVANSAHYYCIRWPESRTSDAELHPAYAKRFKVCWLV
jgi:hypothetical protein